ncbi:MAG: hypothetical protein KME42_13205 [Tildeniella nuda ZEHNDER 1965/U140]|nr:hypothetical protein [Tildeniella nuda ZEHNDER 1965/U140]
MHFNTIALVKAIGYQRSAVSDQRSAVSYQRSAISGQQENAVSDQVLDR